MRGDSGVFPKLKRFAAPMAVLAAAALVLLLVARQVDLHAVFIDGLGGAMSDQIAYISVARHLVDGDGFVSSTIFPSVLAQNATRNYFYMPGHYVALAASFLIFGYSAWSAFLPNVLAFIGSALLVWFIARRLYGPWPAAFAVALFIVFPLNAILAWSAMSELTLTFAVLAAVAIFLIVPERWQIIAGALLVAITFMFRQTGAMVVLPMSMLALRPPHGAPHFRWRAALGLVAASVVACLLVAKSPIASGMPSLFINNLAGGTVSDIYTDAYAMEHVDRSPANLRRLVRLKFERNLGTLEAPLKHPPEPSDSEPNERFVMWWLLAGVPIGLLAWIVRKDWFAAGVAAAVLVLLITELMFYTIWAHRGVRVLLMMQPFVAMVFASLWSALLRLRWVAAIVAVALAGLLASQLREYTGVVYAPQNELNAAEARAEEFFESLKIDDSRAVVAPGNLVLKYLLDHHPVRWSFMPANQRTMRLLMTKYDVGTVVYRAESWPQVTREELEQDGFRAARTARYNGAEIVVLERPRVLTPGAR
jgi:4-amino-4-deoxy-L-arabinose transferase-like glycosyltransferase